jgi:hypothetical protein
LRKKKLKKKTNFYEAVALEKFTNNEWYFSERERDGGGSADGENVGSECAGTNNAPVGFILGRTSEPLPVHRRRVHPTGRVETFAGEKTKPVRVRWV